MEATVRIYLRSSLKNMPFVSGNLLTDVIEFKFTAMWALHIEIQTIKDLASEYSPFDGFSAFVLNLSGDRNGSSLYFLVCFWLLLFNLLCDRCCFVATVQTTAILSQSNIDPEKRSFHLISFEWADKVIFLFDSSVQINTIYQPFNLQDKK